MEPTRLMLVQSSRGGARLILRVMSRKQETPTAQKRKHPAAKSLTDIQVFPILENDVSGVTDAAACLILMPDLRPSGNSP